MHRTPIRKFQAALTIEETFHQPRHQQNWLLTYLDVFILIVMLVITLIAISDFDPEQKSDKTQKQHQYITKSLLNTKTNDKQKSGNEKNDSVTNALNTAQQPQLSALIVTETSEQNKENSAKLDFQNNNKYKENKPKQENQLSDDTLQEQLKKTVEQLGLSDSVEMKVTLGYAQLEIQDKILFKSSKAMLLKDGGTLLKKLTPLLEKSEGLIYIEGHTDNRPIKTAKFPSNWELGAARATSVLHYLASEKLDPNRLRAVSYGDTKPLADNSTKEGREKNRRVSLVIKISDRID